MKKTFVFLMTVFALLCFMTVSASADGIRWSVDAEGALTISGTGAMEDYSSSAVPWYSEDIYAVVVEEGITHVGTYAFNGLFLDNVLLPESLESIGENAFSGAAVTEAHFAGNLKQWRENVTLGSGNGALMDVIVCDNDVTYEGEGFSLAEGVVTSTVSTLPDYFKREYNEYIFEVVFVDVTEIGEHACGGYDPSELAGLPEEEYSYYSDTELTNLISVTIQEGVNIIGDYAFYNCSSLTSVTIPDSLISIGNFVFSGCSGLTNVIIPGSVTSIGDNTFDSCSGLTSVTIGNGVTNIGGGAFNGCSSLTSVQISSLDAWCSIDFSDYLSNPLYFAHNLYKDGILVQELIIPVSVKSIGDYAFYNCSSLTTVTIPDSVTSIGVSAFSYCNGLTSVAIPKSVASIGTYAFDFCSGLTSITLPDSVTSIGTGAFSNCSELTDVTIPDSVTSIGHGAFARCSGLTSVTIGNGVTSIEGSMFHYCYSLTSVTIPDGVISIGDYVFSDCRSLTNVYYTGTAAMWDEITIGIENNYLINAVRHYALAAGDTNDCRWSLSESGILRISGNGRMADYVEGTAPWYAYRGQILTIDIKDAVTYLGSHAFSGLENVPVISGMTGVTGIGEGAFKGCTALSVLTLPATVTSMGQNSFSGCTLLTSAGPVDSGAAIEFGWNKVIPQNAFKGADYLETLTIPEGVTRMMPSAAANCPALSAVSLPTTLVNIQQNAFSGCSSLEEIAFPDALKTLGTSVFRDTGLTSVAIPISVTTIGNNSFDGSLLTDVYYPGSRNQWNAISVGADNTALSGAALHFGRFDINFNTDGGSVIDTMTLAVGSVIVPPTNPTKAAFIFLRWDPALPAAMPAHDLTVKAIWAPVFGTPNFKLPVALKQIKDEAFEGLNYMTVVDIPDGCESIGKWAFKDCTGLTQIRIPATVTNIDELAFEGCADVLVYGTSPSTAKSFCDLHTNCTFVAENTIE